MRNNNSEKEIWIIEKFHKISINNYRLKEMKVFTVELKRHLYIYKYKHHQNAFICLCIRYISYSSIFVYYLDIYTSKDRHHKDKFTHIDESICISMCIYTICMYIHMYVQTYRHMNL